MKNIFKYFIFATIFISGFTAKAQFVTIPDANFVTWLTLNGFSSCLTGNQLDTTCNAVITTKVITCATASITDFTGITYFDSLQSFTCNGNLCTSLPTLPPMLYSINCSNNHLTSLPTLPDSLRSLTCNNNQLTSLPTIPNVLTHLICSFNQLTSLPAMGDSLYYLLANNNSISSIASFPPTLYFMMIQINQLTSLPALPAALNIFYCHTNQLTSLPALPSSLRLLNCNNNSIPSIPTLPAGINTVRFAHNLVSTLPSLPTSVFSLDCSYNLITNIPSFPDSLSFLDCSGNNISSLPPFPPYKLTYVHSDHTLLTTTPDFPPLVRDISLAGNQLQSIGELPDTLTSLNISSNTSLSCLPQLSYSIQTFYWDSTAITCLPNLFIYSVVYPAVDTVPVCDINNTNNCQLHWNLKGVVYSDVNSNCVDDAGDVTSPHVKVKLYENGNLIQQTFSDAAGRYTFSVDTGIYYCEIDTAVYAVTSCIIGYNVVVNASQLYHDSLDFGINCSSGFDVGVLSIIRNSVVFRPGNIASVNVLAGDMSSISSLHCATGIAGTVTVIIHGPADYNSSTLGSLTPAVSGDTLVYSIPDFSLVNFYTDFGFSVLVDTNAIIGSAVCFDVIVQSVTGDINLSNNTLSHCFNVVNSYDPNEKEVSPLYTWDMDTAQHDLTYTIYFQNTGNAPAQNIYIKDTLDSNVDINTLQLITYSDEPTVTSTGNVLLFRFDNINLPDSVSDEPGSHGFVQYKVRTNGNLTVGTQVHNIAYIYFDYNTPIKTNDAVYQVLLSPGIFSNDESHGVNLFPNPVQSGKSINIKFSDDLKSEVTFILIDISGKEVLRKKLSARRNNHITIPELDEGIYQCVFENKDLRVREKLMIVK